MHRRYAEGIGSEVHRPDNLLDRATAAGTLEHHYGYAAAREREILDRRLGLRSGDVLAVGAGWYPGRHLFPAPAWRLTAVDPDHAVVAQALETGAADAAFAGRGGHLDQLPDGSFDVVLYRLVMHHIAYREPLDACFAEAARLLRPGGALVAIEPNLWHPVGLALAAANRSGLATAVHGTPDDIPLSPRQLVRQAREAGLQPELHAVSYSWRRLPVPVQRALWRLDRFGSRSRLVWLGHTILLVASTQG